jgi:hypothetical protein
VTSHPAASSLGVLEETAERTESPGRVSEVATYAARSPVTWLAFIVGFSTLVRGALAARVPSPWILPDEIVYSDLAKSIAGGHLPSVRGVPVFGWGIVYPTLIAPAWAVLDDPVHAYHAALVISAFVMSLAAVPAYLLARLFVSRAMSFLVAAFTVIVPSMAYTGVVMTESAFYPLFLLAVLLVARAVQRPTVARQAVAVLGLGLLALTRIQGVALGGAYLLAIVIYAFSGPSPDRRSYLHRFVPTAAALVVVPLVPVAASIARGDGLFGWLGGRSGTFAALRLIEVPKWLAYLLADLVLYVALVPVASTVVVAARALFRQMGEQERLFAAVAAATLAAMLGSVAFVSASVDVDGNKNLDERYVFYVIPLLFIGMALWIRDGLPRRQPWASYVVVACCGLALLLPIDRLHYNAGFQSVALLPWIGLSLSGASLEIFVGAFTLACGLIWLTCRWDRAGRLWVLVGIWLGFVGVLAVGSNDRLSANFARPLAGMPPTWVDAAASDARTVPVLWDERLASPQPPDATYLALIATELFNFKIGDVYRLGPGTHYENVLPTLPVRLGRGRSVIDGQGRKLETRFVLVSCRTPVEGRVVAQTADGALQLVEVTGPVRVIGDPQCLRSIP